MTDKPSTWEYEGTLFRRCLKCNDAIPAFWGEHKKCGWVAEPTNIEKADDKEAANLISKPEEIDTELMKRCLTDSVRMSETFEGGKYKDSFNWTKIALTLFIDRRRRR
jgi:hypothetical protein